MNEPILTVKDLTVHYGGIEAVKGISLEVSEGEIVTLIGANGAGKSSTLRSIAGLVKQRARPTARRPICGCSPWMSAARRCCGG